MAIFFNFIKECSDDLA